MSYETKKSTRNDRLMRIRNNRMYQLDQVTLKIKKIKKEREREREREREKRTWTAGCWCAVTVR